LADGFRHPFPDFPTYSHPMRKVSFFTGALLVVLGVVAYFLQDAGQRSPTALIPAVIGLVFLLCGAMATTPARNKHAMHVAALFGLVGASTLGMALPKLIKAAGGEAMARPLAVYTQLGTGLICLVFLVLAVRSFVTARMMKPKA
jgi:hypothetical protein